MYTLLVFTVKHNQYNILVFFIVFLATCFGHTILPSSGYLGGYILYYITLHTYYICIYTTTRPAIM
jgi:hypothetical protein